jgi:hypothetical protein
MQQIQKNPYTRSPTLNTVLMIEKTIKEYSGEFNRRQLWQKLSKKAMWQTYLIVLDYLQNINKIALDKNGTIVYIWNPKLTKTLSKRPVIKL